MGLTWYLGLNKRCWVSGRSTDSTWNHPSTPNHTIFIVHVKRKCFFAFLRTKMNYHQMHPSCHCWCVPINWTCLLFWLFLLWNKSVCPKMAMASTCKDVSISTLFKIYIVCLKVVTISPCKHTETLDTIFDHHHNQSVCFTSHHKFVVKEKNRGWIWNAVISTTGGHC